MNNEDPQLVGKNPPENENHDPIPETFKNPEITQNTQMQNSPKPPKITQKLTNKKQKKSLIQEVESTTYSQTLTLTTQTLTDIEKRIKRLKDFN